MTAENPTRKPRKLTHLEIVEGSLVDAPANPLARVVLFKRAEAKRAAKAGEEGAADKFMALAERLVATHQARTITDALVVGAKLRPDLYAEYRREALANGRRGGGGTR
jgi:hypothetical protein